MAAGDWVNGWAPGNYIPAAEMAKGWGCFYDTTTSGSTALSVTVPTWGTDLRFTFQAHGTIGTYLGMQFNGSSGGSYQSQFDTTYGVTESAVEDVGFSSLVLATFATNSTVASHCWGEVTVANYRGTAFWKSMHCRGGIVFNAGAASGVAGIQQQSMSGVWFGTAAITTVSFLPDAGSITAGHFRGYVSG